jgi:hypothetical protein
MSILEIFQKHDSFEMHTKNIRTCKFNHGFFYSLKVH